MANTKAIGAVSNGAFHYANEVATVQNTSSYLYDQVTFTYRFENLFHPLVGKLIRRLNEMSVADMMDPSFLQGPGMVQDFFMSDYDTTQASKGVAFVPFPKEIDVSVGGPYANYNWELFYHIPVAVAVHLSKNQRFAEAQKWFHLVFDPTSTDPPTTGPERYWNFLGFRSGTGVQNIDELLTTLSTPDKDLDEKQAAVKHAILAGYEQLQKDPFKPHLVARTRPVAYQYYVVMKYLDNLIAWGDSLFQQYTVETINEATLCYVLAANLLGPRPQKMPPRGTIPPRNFRESSLNATASLMQTRSRKGLTLVPTLHVGMPSGTLRVPGQGAGPRRRASKTTLPRGAWERGDFLSFSWWC